MPIEYFLQSIQKFNNVFDKKMHNLDCNLKISPEGRMVDFAFSAKSGYHTPHSNQVVLGLVQRKPGCVQIQVQQGPLIITTADVNFENFEEDPVCGLTLQTNPLSMFNVYPLRVFKHEPNDFFRKCGYGRLSLYFALLYTVSTGRTMAIICENPITAYILFVLFRSCRSPPLKVDMETNVSEYFHNLLQYEMLHGPIEGFEDFDRFFSCHEKQNGQIVYLVHSTEMNQDRITQAIDAWTHERISSVSDQNFMANFFMGPKLHEYHTNPVLQEDYPQFSYKHILTAEPDMY